MTYRIDSLYCDYRLTTTVYRALVVSVEKRQISLYLYANFEMFIICLHLFEELYNVTIHNAISNFNAIILSFRLPIHQPPPHPL